MKKIQYNGSSKILNGIVTKVNLIIDKLVVDVKVNGTSVVVVNDEGEREADIDLSLADQNVKQSPTTSSDNSDYRVLLSKSANDTEETDISRKDTNLKYNPSTGNLQTTKLNGNTVPSGSDTIALTSDIPTQASDIGAIPATEKGANSGVATLDSSGKVPTTQLPSYVDDVVEGYYYNDNFYEDSAHTELITPETSKIYVDLSTDTCYRWGGSAYVEISGGAVQSDWNQNDSSQLDYIKNKPTIPDELADLADDSTHRVVTDTEKSTWNDERVPYGILDTEDLNDLKASAVYVGKYGNTCLNKPTDVAQFSLLVLRTAYSSTQYCEQILITPRGYEWRRNCYQNTWSAWVMSDFTDSKVTQTATSANANYRILLSKSASNAEETDTVQKNSSLYYNPYDEELHVSNIEASNGNFYGLKVIELQTAQYYFSNGSSVVGMLEANSAATASNPIFNTLPASSGTLALQSDITSAINDLDVASTSIGQGETLATIKEENGKIAVTKQAISITNKQIANYCLVGTSSAISGSNTWHKVASVILSSANEDSVIMLAVHDTFPPDTDVEPNGGILYCRARQNALGALNYAKLKFVGNSGFDAKNFRLYCTIVSGTSITVEIWTSLSRQYAFRRFVVLSMGNRWQSNLEKWTLYNSSSASAAPTESSTCVRVECEDNTYKQTDNETLGAKNLIPYPYINGQGSYYVRNNVTISVNENGVISASGSNPSSGFGYGLSSKSKPIVLDPTKSYIMSGLTNGSSSTIRFLLDLWTENQNPVTDAYTTRMYQATTETIIPSGYKYLQITLYFYTGAGSKLPLTVSPMLRLATIVDNTFEPYADTNRNLSMYKADLRLIADTEKTSTASRAYAKNELMFFDGNLYRVKTAIASGGSITLNTNVVATTLSAEIKAIRDALNI